MQVRVFPNFQVLPASYQPFLEERAAESFFSCRKWYENLAQNGMDAGERMCIFAVESGDSDPRPIAILVGFICRLHSGHPGSRIIHFRQGDGLPFVPLLADEAMAQDVFDLIIEYVRDCEPAFDAVRISPLDLGSPRFNSFMNSVSKAGLISHSYFHFGNWYEDTSGLSSEEYFALRSSRLRNTLRRRGKRLEKLGNAQFEFIINGQDLDRPLECYAQIFESSWKSDIDHSIRYMQSVMRCAAEEGALRLGLFHVNGQPASVQFWTVSGGVANCYRLAYNKHLKDLSIGSILTQRMVEYFLDVDNVNEIEFGIGDDTYKKDWASKRRERWGIAAFNPRTRKGVQGAARYYTRKTAKRLIKRMTRRIRGPRPAHEG